VRKANGRTYRTKAERLAIVAESLRGDRSVTEVARRHGVQAKQIYRWRGSQAKVEPAVQLFPVRVTPAGQPEGAIEVGCGEVSLRITGTPDAATLQLILTRVLG
jgi:transposase